ncbi:MAG: hypothetical protein UD961_02535, partial [Bacteroidales bacterium]|nr:hypothetical protein [Bacteroidales bacterium]
SGVDTPPHTYSYKCPVLTASATRCAENHHLAALLPLNGSEINTFERLDWLQWPIFRSTGRF